MTEIREEWLELPGLDGQKRPYKLLTTGEESGHLAVTLPGRSYSADMPALYFPARLLLSHGADVLQVDYGISPQKLLELTLVEQASLAAAVAEAVLRAALAQRNPQRLTLIGKSLGTLAMGHVLECGIDLPRTNCIWLTPILKNEKLVKQMEKVRQMSLVVAGSADPFSDAGVLERLEREVGMRLLVIEKADHSLEVPGNVVESLHNFQRMMRGMDAFLGWGDLKRWWVWS